VSWTVPILLNADGKEALKAQKVDRWAVKKERQDVCSLHGVLAGVTERGQAAKAQDEAPDVSKALRSWALKLCP
jgi:hypothetical protein